MVWRVSDQSTIWEVSDQSATIGSFSISFATNGPYEPDSVFQITVQNPAGPVDFSIDGVIPLSPDSESNNIYTFTTPNLELISGPGPVQAKYGQITIVASDGVESDSVVRTINPSAPFTQDVITSISPNGLYHGASDVEFGVDVFLGGITGGNEDGNVIVNKSTGQYSLKNSSFEYTFYGFDNSASIWVGPVVQVRNTQQIIVPKMTNFYNRMRVA